ncbi:MAG TPA: putative Ig domain-containing protein [Terriglobales bacterium]|nr:putative Ig domain-containing protein [Terriglobales bacterium]
MTPISVIGPKRILHLSFSLLSLALFTLSSPAATNNEVRYRSSTSNTAQLVISPTTLPAATQRTFYSTKLTVNGGSAPYRFSTLRSAMPTGLTLSSGGIISGTPTVTGSFYVRVLVTDSSSNRVERTLSVAVKNPSTSSVGISVSPISSSVSSAGTAQFSALVSGTSNTSVTWSTTIGSITQLGKFTAPTVSGTTSATVTATSVADNTKSAKAVVSITAASSSVMVQITPGNSSLKSGGTQQFAATVRDSSTNAVTWSTSAGKISSSGLYTAPAVTTTTTATVTATSVANTTRHATATITIGSSSGTPISVQMTPTSASIKSAGTQLFSATVSNTSNTGVTWSASMGSISSAGLYTAPSVTTSTSAVVTARSVADTTKYAQSTISIAAPSTSPSSSQPPPVTTTNNGPDNRYCNPGNAANFGATSDTVATLPTACFYTAMAATPSPGTVIAVSAGGNLQGALNSANCGDTITIQAGAVFSGTFTLPAKSCDDQHWITIRTSAPNSSLPPEGTRLTPCYAGVGSLPNRPAYACTSSANVMPRILAGGNQAFITASGANHYRLIGLEITHPANMPIGQPDTLVAITDATSLPDHVIVDRCWIHGLPTAFLKRGVKIDGNDLAVIDSTVTDVHAVGTATQGILSGTGTGPLKIVNNFVEGGDSAVGFGGQGNPFGNPTDVEIRRNHLFKPWSWQAGNPAYLGYPFSAKVALESKNSNRVLIEANIMENTWGDQPGGPAQGGDGSISWLGPKSQNSQCPSCDVSDVTIRYNLLRHAGGGFYIFDSTSDTGAIALQARRYSIHDNLLDDISTVYSRAGSGNGILNRFLGSSIYAPPANVNVFHNTGLAVGAAVLSLNGTSTMPYVGFTYANNLESDGNYGILGCSGQLGMNVLSSCAPGYVWSNNVVLGSTSSLVSPSAVGFVNYKNGNGGDYRLCQGPGIPASTCTAASPYANAATDGRDLGADIATVNALTAGVN